MMDPNNNAILAQQYAEIVAKNPAVIPQITPQAPVAPTDPTVTVQPPLDPAQPAVTPLP